MKTPFTCELCDIKTKKQKILLTPLNQKKRARSLAESSRNEHTEKPSFPFTSFRLHFHSKLIMMKKKHTMHTHSEWTRKGDTRSRREKMNCYWQLCFSKRRRDVFVFYCRLCVGFLARATAPRISQVKAVVRFVLYANCSLAFSCRLAKQKRTKMSQAS